MTDSKTRGANNSNAFNIGESGREALQSRLRGVGIGEDVLVPLRGETKESYQDHTDAANRADLDAIHRLDNYAVYPVDGLIAVDVDTPGEVPSWVRELPDTFTVSSPHGGEHRYYAVDGTVGNAGFSWGEIRAEGWYVVGPGSTLDHDGYCGEDCEKTGETGYEVARDQPISAILADNLPLDMDESEDNDPENDANDSPFGGELPEVNSGSVAVVEANIRHFRDKSITGSRAFEDLLDVLQGGTGSFEDLRRDRSIDRSKADTRALWMLYGIHRYLGESHERARELAYAGYTHYCDQKRYTEDGQPRKWRIRSENYRRNRLNRATEDFNPDVWTRWRRKGESRRFGGNRSELCYDVVMAAISILCDEIEPEPDLVRLNFGIDARPLEHTPHLCTGVHPGHSDGHGQPNRPTKSEIVELAQVLDPERSPDTHGKVLQKLQSEQGQIKAARMDRTKWVYYPADLSDPEEACYVKYEGEKYEPEADPQPEQEDSIIMTDGGTEVDTEEELRQEYDEIVISTNGKSSKKLHLPSEESEGPLCGHQLHSREWRTKSIEVYPPGYREWCLSCLVEIEDTNDSPSPAMYEGAATSDWAT